MLEDGIEVEKLKVQSNGTVTTYITGQLNTLCEINPAKFPFDCHKCAIMIGASPASSKMVFELDEVNFESVENNNPIWKLNKATPMKLGPSLMNLEITMERLPEYYIYNIVIPASALSALAICSFFIPINEGERISFSITILLSFMVLMLQVSTILPENSKNLSAVGECINFNTLLKFLVGFVLLHLYFYANVL